MGAESYYLYDDSAMTDAYARWAFLAAEDDPVATFIECVREVVGLPPPHGAGELANDPFRMNAEAVEAAFAEPARRVAPTTSSAWKLPTATSTSIPRRI